MSSDLHSEAKEEHELFMINNSDMEIDGDAESDTSSECACNASDNNDDKVVVTFSTYMGNYLNSKRTEGLIFIAVLAFVGIALVVWMDSKYGPSPTTFDFIFASFILLNLLVCVGIALLGQYASALMALFGVVLLFPMTFKSITKNSILGLSALITLLGGVSGLFSV